MINFAINYHYDFTTATTIVTEVFLRKKTLSACFEL